MRNIYIPQWERWSLSLIFPVDRGEVSIENSHVYRRTTMSMINVSEQEIQRSRFCPEQLANHIYGGTHHHRGVVLGTDIRIHLLPEAKTALHDRGVCHDDFAARTIEHLRRKLG